MNTELAGSMLSTTASDQIPLVSYVCRVTVEKDEAGRHQTFTDGFVELHSQRKRGSEVRIKQGEICRIQFNIETPGWKFPTIAPFSRNQEVGPFRWAFDTGSPSVQKDAGLEIPPRLRVEIDPENQQWATLEVLNRHRHRLVCYRYSLLVVAYGARPCLDPVLIEEPYEGPVDPPPPGS
jgi:hypothetical protein